MNALRIAILTSAFLLLSADLAIDPPVYQKTVAPLATAEEFSESKFVPVDYSGITFSHTENFYAEDISLELSADGTIRYTLDGSEPTEASVEYTEPILIKAEDEVRATTVRAAVFENGTPSGIAVKSYVTGTDVFKRFDPSTLVFVLSSDPYNLYDYDYGVCVEGRIRDEWLQSDEYSPELMDENPPANWSMTGRESERDMYVEAFDSFGNKIVDQAAGGRVVGGYSRAVDQKSWRLFARSEYWAGGKKFYYDFFPDATNNLGAPIDQYDTITLRNNANDREFASVREELLCRLAADAGFPDTQQARPAAVFLNSEYYGFSWLHEAFSDDYLDDTYGGTKSQYAIVEGTEYDVSGDDPQSVADYEYMYNLAAGGLTDDARFEEFCSLVDIDNFILYYAIQIYVDNKDWPNNNYKCWRYYPANGEQTESEFLDGKWRWLLYDIEFSSGLYEAGYNFNSLTGVLTGKNRFAGSSLLLNAVLEREDMQGKFATTLSDLCYHSFNEEKMCAMLDRTIEECDVECSYALKNGYTSEWANESTFEFNRNLIRLFAGGRPTVMLMDMIRTFDLDYSAYGVTLTVDGNGSARLNSITVQEGETVEVRYFTRYSVPLSVESGLFDYWEINGKRYDTQELVLDASMAESNSISVILHTK